MANKVIGTLKLVHPHWHSVVSTNHEPVLVAQKGDNYYEVAGKRQWPVNSCTVVNECEVKIKKKGLFW